MHEAYTGAGGQAKLIAYGPFKGDAHRTFSDRDGFAVWWPETESFLAALGMPTAVLPRSVGDDPALAALTDATRIPFVKDNCVRTYNQFLDADYPRAYAIAPDGSCGYAYGGEDPKKRALEFCQKRAKDACKLYAVDNTLVWN